MTHIPPHDRLPAGAVLADDAIELRLLRILEPGDASTRPPDARFLSAALEYRFAIHSRADGLRVGRIHLRVTDDPLILRALGHAGYEVDERIDGTGTPRGPSVLSAALGAHRAGQRRLAQNRGAGGIHPGG